MILARDALLEAFPGKPRASGDDPAGQDGSGRGGE